MKRTGLGARGLPERERNAPGPSRTALRSSLCAVVTFHRDLKPAKIPAVDELARSVSTPV